MRALLDRIAGRSEGAPERREAGGAPFGEAVASAFYAAALGSDAVPSVLALGAVETAAGLWSRGFAAAEVDGDRGALTAPTLALIARDLCRRGESIHAIRVRDGHVSLLPVGTWDVRGGPEPESWFYRVDVFGASDHMTYVLPAASVLHVRYSFDAERPWLGVSPLARAHATGMLAAWLERRMGEEASAAAGHVLPVPDRHGDHGDGETSDPLHDLKNDLAKIAGKTLLVETTSAAWGDGRPAAPMGDWKPQRIGSAIPEPSVKLRGAAFESVLNACGIPISLTGHGEASGLREAWRVFLHGTLAPIGRLIEHEAGMKLDATVRITFDSLFASDLQGRARSYKSLVDGGMPGPDAAVLCGFER